MTSILISLLCFAFIIFSIGSASALFLSSLGKAAQLFFTHDFLVLWLPILGLLTGLTYWYFGKKIPSAQKVLHQAHESKAAIPFLTAFFIFLFTILSHLFGASTGRESTAVQFGAALADFWRKIFEKFFRILPFSRQAFVRTGLAAGFGAVFGVPWAGALFALEVTPQRRWPLRYLPLCWMASFGAHWTALWWGTRHRQYPPLEVLVWNLNLALKWLCLGIAFGLAAKLFIICIQNIERHFFRRFFPPWLRPAIGGVLIAALTLWFHDTRYNGLGLQLIEASFSSTIHTFDFAWKGLFTVLSSASGLKGGEVTPLMAIGSTLGAFLAGWLAVPVTYAASLGLVSVFASSAHIPWTGAVMAWEFFGFEAFLPTFVVCWFARRAVGLNGLFNVSE